MPVRVIITKGTTADCMQTNKLIEGFAAEALLADRAYDTDAIIESATLAEMEVIFPSKKNRKAQREYDKDLYKLRPLVENAFLELKQWRRIATRYVKTPLLFWRPSIQVRCIAIWAKIY